MRKGRTQTWLLSDRAQRIAKSTEMLEFLIKHVTKETGTKQVLRSVVKVLNTPGVPAPRKERRYVIDGKRQW